MPAPRTLLRWLVRATALMAGLLALGVAGLLWAVTQPVGAVDVRGRAPSVDPARLEAHVRKLVSLGPRDFTHPENLDKVAGYIRSELEASGARVSEQPYTAEGRGYRNLVASFGPVTGEKVVVGAHYDAEGEHPAADDNASGVAGLIELARLLGKKPPSLGVELVAYSLEEPPFFRTEHMGSRVHADALKQAGVSVRAMVSVEMIGYFDDRPDTQRFPLSVLGHVYPTTGNFITVVGRFGQGALVRQVKRGMLEGGELPVHSINAAPKLVGIDFSDHLNYWRHDWPAVMVTDTAFYRNERYHTERDTPESLDYRRMAQVVRGLHGAVESLAR